jgi:hypothetical protein
LKELKLDYFQLFFTGHSLGGWLAQITALIAKYPYLVNKTAEYCRLVQHEEEGCYVHTLVFDSPGCEQMLLKIADEFSMRYCIKTSIDVYSLDITSYFSAPNRINTFNRHVGKIYRIIIDFKDQTNSNNNLNFFDTAFQTLKQLLQIEEIKNWYQYNNKAHSIISILEAFDNSSPGKIYEVVDWPYCNLSNRQEYNDFFKFIQDYKLNNYHVDENHEHICPIRYKTKHFDENNCSMNVFTETEQNFLKIYEILRSDSKFFQPESLFNSIGDDKSKAQDILKTSQVKDGVVRFETAEKLRKFISYVKILLKLFPTVKAETIKQSFDYDIYRKFYQLESNQYLTCFDFKQNENKNKSEESLTDFLENKIKVWHMVVEKDTKIQVAIIYKVLERIQSEYNIVAISLDRLLNANQELPLIKLFEFNEMTHHLLLIEFKPNNDIVFNKFKDLLNNLISLNSKSKFIKIILVTQDGSYTNQELINNCLCNNISYKQTKPEGIKWNDLTSETQDKILEKKVLFQGKPLSLNELIQKDTQISKDELNELFDTKTLIKLLNNDLIKIGSELSFDDSFYISRSLSYQISINKDAFKKIDDTFVISGNISKQLSNNCIIVSNDEEALSKFKESSQIHWFKYEPYTQSYIWQRSNGNISGLRQYIEKKLEDEKCIVTGRITEVSNKSKIVIISDTAGMGKSTFLTYVSKLLKESSFNNNDSWLIRLNLNDFTDKLEQYRSFNIDTAIDFLSDNLETNFEKELFKLNMRSRKSIIMFDGFDEISPTYKNIVISLLQVLKNVVKQLWITTRPNMRVELEDNLEQFAYNLKPLSRQDQTNFLTKCWMHKLNISDSTKLKIYAEALLNNLIESIRDNELTGIPLQSRMLAEVYQKECESFYNSDLVKPVLDARLDLID